MGDILPPSKETNIRQRGDNIKLVSKADPGKRPLLDRESGVYILDYAVRIRQIVAPAWFGRNYRSECARWPANTTRAIPEGCHIDCANNTDKRDNQPECFAIIAVQHDHDKYQPDCQSDEGCTSLV